MQMQQKQPDKPTVVRLAYQNQNIKKLEKYLNELHDKPNKKKA